MRNVIYELRLETGVQKHKVLEVFEAIDEECYISFVQYEKGQIYKLKEGRYSIGAPFFYYKKITESEYKTLSKEFNQKYKKI